MTLGKGGVQVETLDLLLLNRESKAMCEGCPQICGWGLGWLTGQPTISSSHWNLPPGSTGKWAKGGRANLRQNQSDFVTVSQLPSWATVTHVAPAALDPLCLDTHQPVLTLKSLSRGNVSQKHPGKD